MDIMAMVNYVYTKFRNNIEDQFEELRFELTITSTTSETRISWPLSEMAHNSNNHQIGYEQNEIVSGLLIHRV